jgi:hypothetical protein
MSLDLELPYGVAADGRMVPVAGVERGLACNCRCPQCDRRLVAKQGDVKRWHFAHEADANCAGAFESMVHRLAKQIIADHGVVHVPALIGFHPETPTLFDAADVALTDVRLEVWQQGYRPDAIATMPDGAPLVIEVRVTHACEPAKLERLRDRNVAAIEIDLSGYRGEHTEALLTDLVLREAHRIWLHHPRQQADAVAALVRLAAEEAKRQLAKREAAAIHTQNEHARAYHERLLAAHRGRYGSRRF